MCKLSCTLQMHFTHYMTKKINSKRKMFHKDDFYKKRNPDINLLNYFVIVLTLWLYFVTCRN